MGGAIDVHSVFLPLAKEFAAVIFEVTDERLAFHAAEREMASRITPGQRFVLLRVRDSHRAQE